MNRNVERNTYSSTERWASKITNIPLKQRLHWRATGSRLIGVELEFQELKFGTRNKSVEAGIFEFVEAGVLALNSNVEFRSSASSREKKS